MDQHAVLDMSRVDGSDPSHGHEAIDEAVTRYRGMFEDYDGDAADAHLRPFSRWFPARANPAIASLEAE